MNRHRKSPSCDGFNRWFMRAGIALLDVPKESLSRHGEPRRGRELYGTNFRHAVEFSRNGRSPFRTLSGPVRGNPANLPGGSDLVKSVNRTRSAPLLTVQPAYRSLRRPVTGFVLVGEGFAGAWIVSPCRRPVRSAQNETLDSNQDPVKSNRRPRALLAALPAVRPRHPDRDRAGRMQFPPVH